VGDGLVSQLPAFVISIAAALIVTRSGSRAELGDELSDQLISQPRGLAITAVFLAILSASPLPTFPLLGTAIGLGALAFGMERASRRRRAAAEAPKRAAEAKPEPPPVDSLLKVDVMELEIGYGLVGLVDQRQGGQLLDRIGAIRRQLATELGLVAPPVRIRDNVQLGPNEYRVRIRGAEVARGETRPNRLLAMDPGIASGPIEGEAAKEPAFGLDAKWIDESLRARAESLNYTVVDATSVVATHLTEVIKTHASELLTREEVNNMVENLKERAPKLVEDVVPGVVKLGELQKVLQGLLRERVPIRDLETILEALADWAPKTKDLDVLLEYVRNGLRRTICQQYAAPAGGPEGKSKLVCVTLDPGLEDAVAAHIDRGPGGSTVNVPAGTASRVSDRIARGLQRLTAAGHWPVVLASPQVRSVVRQLLEARIPNVAVLGYNEITGDVEVESVALVSMGEEPGSGAASPPTGAPEPAHTAA